MNDVRFEHRNGSLRPGQFSISAVLAAMVVVAATLAVFRLSLFGGIVFSAIALPALGRTYWAEFLRRRAGVRDSVADGVSMYFISVAVMMFISLGSTGALMLGCMIGFFYDPFGNSALPLRLGIGLAVVAHVIFFWIGRPRPPHYLP